MARVEDSSLHNFSTGEKVTENTLDQNFKVLQVAVNANDKVLEDLGINNFAPATFNSLLKTSTTFNQLKFGYVKGITDPLDSRVTALETVATKPPVVEEITATADNQTVFTLVTSTYNVGKGEIEVEVEGVPQFSGTGFTETDSKTITLAEGVVAGSVIRVIINQTPTSLSEKLAGYDTQLAQKVASTNIKNIRDNSNVFEYSLDGIVWKQVQSGGGGNANTYPTIKYLDDYSSYVSNGDWIPAFNAAFADLTAKGGGILKLTRNALDTVNGYYTIKSVINIPSGVNVVGEGVGVTIIKLADGIDSDMVNFDTNDNCGISYLQLSGNVWGANPSVNKTGIILGRAGLDFTNGNMINLNIHDVFIRDIGGDGFHCFPNTWVYSINRMRIEFCSGYAAFVESTDNTYTDWYINGIGKTGLYVSGSNNRFSDMKIIFCGRGAIASGGTAVGSGNDFDAGVYDTGKRNQFANIECQENYGHGFVFDNATDTTLMGLLSDANGYHMIATNAAATAIGFYFKGAKRISGDIKATIFKATISQKQGYYIDAGCADINLEYSNDHDQTETNLSTTCFVSTPSKKTTWDSSSNYTAGKQYNDFLASGTVLNNLITAYDSANFQLGTSLVSSYTIVGNEFQNIITNWSGTAGTASRFGTGHKTVTQGRTYLCRLRVKPSVDNYFLRLDAFYDEGTYDYVKRTDATYMSADYTDLTFTFTADRTSTAFIVALWDNLGSGNNPVQHTFNAKEFAIIDITDSLAQYYLVSTLDKVVKNNYFLGSHTFSSGAAAPPAIETAWEDFTPTLTWVTATPLTPTVIGRRKISGKTVWFNVYISCTDGNGATGLTIKPPNDMLPKQNSLYPPFYNTVVIGTSTNVNRQLSLRDDVNQDITFGFMGTATAGQLLKIYFQGFYELP